CGCAATCSGFYGTKFAQFGVWYESLPVGRLLAKLPRRVILSFAVFKMATPLQTLFGEWPVESLQMVDGNHSIKVKLLNMIYTLLNCQSGTIDQQDLVNNEYGRVMFISFCTAGGIGEEHNKKICNGLFYIYWFLKDLHEGKTYVQPSFQPLPLLARITKEQIEEEGANEEVDAQMNNYNGYDGYIREWANEAKAAIMNRFIHRG
ncbi:MAG: hypothetical protein EZS28_028787, partial [Streblomastix strix]